MKTKKTLSSRFVARDIMVIRENMPLVAIVAALIILSNSQSALSETYRWVDSQGITHYSDHPPNNNEGGRNIPVEKLESFGNESQPVAKTDLGARAQHIYKTAFSLDSEMSQYIKEILSLFIAEGFISLSDAKKIKTDEDGSAILHYAKTLKEPPAKIDIGEVFGSPSSLYSSPETTLRTYINALTNYDTNAAIECLMPSERYKLREILSTLPRDVVINTGANSSFEKTELKKNSALYLRLERSNGKIYESEIRLYRIFGNWKMQGW